MNRINWCIEEADQDKKQLMKPADGTPFNDEELAELKAFLSGLRQNLMHL